MVAPSADARRARRHADMRAEIVAAAWRLARERGLAGWSLRELADEVGMRAPSLYVYFADKDAIYDEMFADGYRELEAEFATLVAAPVADPVGHLRRVARCFVDFCVADPARFQLLFLRPLPGFAPSDASYERARRVLDRLARALLDAGIVRTEALDVWTAAMTGLASQQISNDPGGDRWTRLVDEVVQMLTDAFGVGRGPQVEW